ncbi:MAG: KEOPS complex subunit Pcc1 [Haloferacaceae archaeon]
MTRPHAATLSFVYTDEQRARLVADAVAVERGELEDDRTRATLAREGNAVEVTVESRDLVGLRAGMNSWIRLIEVAERTDAVAVGPSE